MGSEIMIELLCVPTLISLSSLLPPGIILCSMVSLYLTSSDTVEKRMIPGGSNNERLTNRGTNEVVPTSFSLSLHS